MQEPVCLLVTLPCAFFSTEKLWILQLDKVISAPCTHGFIFFEDIKLSWIQLLIFCFHAGSYTQDIPLGKYKHHTQYPHIDDVHTCTDCAHADTHTQTAHAESTCVEANIHTLMHLSTYRYTHTQTYTNISEHWLYIAGIHIYTLPPPPTYTHTYTNLHTRKHNHAHMAHIHILIMHTHA